MAAFGEFSGSILVSDASVLINFLRIDRIDLSAAVSYESMATDHVADEISEAYPEQRVRYQAALDRCALKFLNNIQPSLQQILRLLQINLFERRYLLELLRGDPPQPGISPNQTVLLFSWKFMGQQWFGVGIERVRPVGHGAYRCLPA